MKQELQLTQLYLDQPSPYLPNPSIKIYRQASAPVNLQSLATKHLQVMSVMTDNGPSELHYFKQNFRDQDYILTYIEDNRLGDNDYPVLAIFEHFEDISHKAIVLAIALSLLIALLFSYLSSKAIIKPLLDLKQAVEMDHQRLTELANLPSEVGVLARAIEDKNNKLAQYLEREQLFTGDVSHELRTPLTIIMGAAEVLASQLPGDSKLNEFTTRIGTTAAETSEIITALLLLSRAPEKLDAPITSINNIAHSEVARLGYLLRYKPVKCHVEAAQEFTANVRPELLKMALGNLIKNAFQYTEQGEVTITIDQTTITVADSGIGISNEMMPLLYERFERGVENHQVESAEPSHTVEGSGLGLSIVQRIMSHLGWTLSHRANETGGSTFMIQYKLG